MNIYEKASEIEEYANGYCSGSGFDSNYETTVYEGQNTIHLNTFYHCMHATGYYVGYTPIKVIYTYEKEGHYSEIKSIRYRKEYHGCYLGESIGDIIAENLGCFK